MRLAYFTLVALFLLGSLPTFVRTQDIEEGGIRDRPAAVTFCMELQRAVDHQEKAKVASWVESFPIEVWQVGGSILVADDTDFVQRFNLIFDSGLKKSLMSSAACDLPLHLESTAKIANNKIKIDQVGTPPKTVIFSISAPPDAQSAYAENSAYEAGAAEFYKNLRKAVGRNDAHLVAQMCRYPLTVNSGGAHRTIRNRAELVAQYKAVFTPDVRQAIMRLAAPIHMGWRGFMTDRGEVWLDLVVGTHVFRVFTVNTGSGLSEKPAQKRPD